MTPWYRTMGRTWTDLDSLESPRGSLSVDSIPGWSRASKNPEEDISPNTHRLLFAHEGPNGWVIGLRADVPHVQYNMDHTSTQGHLLSSAKPISKVLWLTHRSDNGPYSNRLCQDIFLQCGLNFQWDESSGLDAPRIGETINRLLDQQDFHR